MLYFQYGLSSNIIKFSLDYQNMQDIESKIL